METGSELSKTVAIFIVQKILADDLGLQYICQTYERFYAVGTVLANMVDALVESQAVRLLKHVVRCYLRMSDNPRYVVGRQKNIFITFGLIAIFTGQERLFVPAFQRLCRITPSTPFSRATWLPSDAFKPS